MQNDNNEHQQMVDQANQTYVQEVLAQPLFPAPTVEDVMSQPFSVVPTEQVALMDIPRDKWTPEQVKMFNDLAENFNEPALDDGLPPYTVTTTTDTGNPAILSETTIEPGLQGSLLNAGFNTGHASDSIAAINLETMEGYQVGEPDETGEEVSSPIMMIPEIDPNGFEMAPKKRSSNATNLLLAAASAMTGMNLDPMSMIPRKYLRERKTYDPKYDPVRSAEQAVWNAKEDEKKKALKAWKKAVPRSERVLPKKKGK